MGKVKKKIVKFSTKLLTPPPPLLEKKNEQAGAELCQAQQSFSLAMM